MNKTRVIITNAKVKELNQKIESCRYLSFEMYKSNINQNLQKEIERLADFKNFNTKEYIIDVATDLVILFANTFSGIKIFREELEYEDMEILFEDLAAIASCLEKDTIFLLENYKLPTIDISYYPYFLFEAMLDLGFEPYKCMEEKLKSLSVFHDSYKPNYESCKIK